MKPAFSITLMAIILVLAIGVLQKPLTAAAGSEKVLLIMKERYGSSDTEFVGSEAVLMKNLLERCWELNWGSLGCDNQSAIFKLNCRLIRRCTQ